MDISTILKAYGIVNYELSPLGNGLINKTWLVKETLNGRNLVFQRVNHKIFMHPEDITYNIRLISDYLNEKHQEYLFTSPVQALNMSDMIRDDEDGYFRMFLYVDGSVTHNELTK